MNRKEKYRVHDHTFVICAYGESPFLEECILSIKKQKLLGNIILVTATPNEYIRGLAKKYSLELFVNLNGGGIAKDWNYGIEVAKTKLVTLIHQDDVYKSTYLKEVLEAINNSDNPLIAFTDYGELRNGQEITDGQILKIKRIMLFPLKSKCLQRNIWVRRRILAMGSAICCPSVTLVKENLRMPIFKEGMKSNLDWEAWENISKEKGAFVYCNKILMSHRIHAESTTSQIIGDNNRVKEDYVMFCKFWPKWIAKIILSFYRKSEKSNDLNGGK